MTAYAILLGKFALDCLRRLVEIFGVPIALYGNRLPMLAMAALTWMGVVIVFFDLLEIRIYRPSRIQTAVDRY